MPRDDRFESFQFYISDWRASERVRRMSCVARAVYFDLLLVAYECGSLPCDDALLSELGRCSRREWRTCKAQVLDMFELIDGRYRNDKVDEQRAKRMSIRDVRSAIGSSGGVAKAKQLLVTKGSNSHSKPVAIASVENKQLLTREHSARPQTSDLRPQTSWRAGVLPGSEQPENPTETDSAPEPGEVFPAIPQDPAPASPARGKTGLEPTGETLNRIASGSGLVSEAHRPKRAYPLIAYASMKEHLLRFAIQLTARQDWEQPDIPMIEAALAACNGQHGPAADFLRREALRKRPLGSTPLEMRTYGLPVKLLTDHFAPKETTDEQTD